MQSLALSSLSARLRSSASNKRNQKGFTLVELLIVVVIIGILSAVGIPAYLNQAKKAKENSAKSAAANAARACAAHIAAGETGSFTQTGVTITGTCDSSNTGDVVFKFTNDAATAEVTMSGNGEVKGI